MTVSAGALAREMPYRRGKPESFFAMHFFATGRQVVTSYDPGARSASSSPLSAAQYRLSGDWPCLRSSVRLSTRWEQSWLDLQLALKTVGEF
jgi:hypothetical protein